MSNSLEKIHVEFLESSSGQGLGEVFSINKGLNLNSCLRITFVRELFLDQLMIHGERKYSQNIVTNATS